MKKRIRLTESQLNRVIKESVKGVINELDWKTYANAYLKAKDYVKNNWDNDFRYIDKLQTDKDLLNRYEKYLKNVDRYNDFLEKADQEFQKNISPDIQANGPLYFDFNDDGENFWGLSWNEKLENNPEELRRVTDKYSDEWNNMKDFFDGKYEYQKGKGWKKKDGLDESIRRTIRLTEGNLHNIVKESVSKIINESLYQDSYDWTLSTLDRRLKKHSIEDVVSFAKQELQFMDNMVHRMNGQDKGQYDAYRDFVLKYQN